MNKKIAKKINDSIRDKYTNKVDPRWTTSNYKWIKEISTKIRGGIGVEIARETLDYLNYKVEDSNDRGLYGDLIVSGQGAQVRLATESLTGVLTFNQIERLDKAP